MALVTTTYSPGSCIRCGGADGYELAEGDVVKIFLNQDRNAEFPEWIEGIVVGVAQASATDTSRTYTVQYETDDLEESALLIAGCDISSLICTSCCEILQAQLDAWAVADEPQVTLSYSWLPNGRILLAAKAYSRVPGVTITVYGWNVPDLNEGIADTLISSAEIPDSDDADFLGGEYCVNVTDSAGHSALACVYVRPQRLAFRTENTTITTGNSTKVVALNAGETISSVIQTTAGSGISLESITYAGLNATLTFTSTPSVSPVNLQLLIQRTLP